MLHHWPCASRPTRTTSKKKSYRPEQQDSPRVQALREEFQETLTELRADGARFVFVDESGCQLGMDRRYARAPAGERADCTKPYHRGPTINLIGAIGVASLRCVMTVDGNVDGHVLEAFATEVLGPRLRKNDVVIWDNLRGHSVAGVLAAIEARGAKVVFLPPYSPDLNPIELMWSKLKAIIRRYAPRTTRAFYKALRVAINSITKRDLRNWFKHCGCGGQPT